MNDPGPQRSLPDTNELVVLSVLTDGPQYGYAISKLVSARSEGAVALSAGVMYPLLRRLENAGLVAASWEVVRSERADEGAEGRGRKWYRLTAKGRKRLDQRIRAHRAYLAMVDRFIPPAAEAAT